MAVYTFFLPVNFTSCEQEGFLVEFLENRRSWETQKLPRKSPEKWTFLSLAFYNAPSLHTDNSGKKKAHKL